MFRLDIRKIFFTQSVAEHWTPPQGRAHSPRAARVQGQFGKQAPGGFLGLSVQGQELDSAFVDLFQLGMVCDSTPASVWLSGHCQEAEVWRSAERGVPTPFLKERANPSQICHHAEAQVPLWSAKEGQREGLLPPELPVAAGLCLGSLLHSVPSGCQLRSCYLWILLHKILNMS